MMLAGTNRPFRSPARAGGHLSGVRLMDKWVPAFVGNADWRRSQ